jgi:hypothetical protein
MPDGERPEELAFSVARIEKPRRNAAVGEGFRTWPPSSEVNSRPRKAAEFLAFSGPIDGQRDCRPQASWRSERTCRPTLSGAFSMG